MMPSVSQAQAGFMAMSKTAAGRAKLKYYEAGMDLFAACRAVKAGTGS
jgi:hypothetical protein